MDFAHRSDAMARPRSRELRAIKIPASYDAWRTPKRLKTNFFFVSVVSMDGPNRHLTEKTSKTRWPSPRPSHGRRTFYGRTGGASAPPGPPPSFPPSAIRTANFSAQFFFDRKFFWPNVATTTIDVKVFFFFEML